MAARKRYDSPQPEDAPGDIEARRVNARNILRGFERDRRESLLRAGRVKPRTQAEAEIFAANLLRRRKPRAS